MTTATATLSVKRQETIELQGDESRQLDIIAADAGKSVKELLKEWIAHNIADYFNRRDTVEDEKTHEEILDITDDICRALLQVRDMIEGKAEIIEAEDIFKHMDEND